MGELAVRTTRKDFQVDDVGFSLSVLTSSCFGGINYIPLLNISIPDKAIAIQPDNLACHADRLRSQVATATSGKIKMLLGKLRDVH